MSYYKAEELYKIWCGAGNRDHARFLRAATQSLARGAHPPSRQAPLRGRQLVARRHREACPPGSRQAASQDDPAAARDDGGQRRAKADRDPNTRTAVSGARAAPEAQSVGRSPGHTRACANTPDSDGRAGNEPPNRLGTSSDAPQNLRVFQAASPAWSPLLNSPSSRSFAPPAATAEQVRASPCQMEKLSLCDAGRRDSHMSLRLLALYHPWEEMSNCHQAPLKTCVWWVCGTLGKYANLLPANAQATPKAAPPVEHKQPALAPQPAQQPHPPPAEPLVQQKTHGTPERKATQHKSSVRPGHLAASALRTVQRLKHSAADATEGLLLRGRALLPRSFPSLPRFVQVLSRRMSLKTISPVNVLSTPLPFTLSAHMKLMCRVFCDLFSPGQGLES